MANYVPAAAVIRRLRAFSGFIGRKELCRRFCKFQVKSAGPTRKPPEKLQNLSGIGASGTDGVAVECVDLIGNTKGEGSLLGAH